MKQTLTTGHIFAAGTGLNYRGEDTFSNLKYLAVSMIRYVY